MLYRDAGNYVYACALESALRDAPKSKWHTHEHCEEKAGDMIEIMLGLAWVDGGRNIDHLVWRDAIEDLVRKAVTRIGFLSEHSRHRYVM